MNRAWVKSISVLIVLLLQENYTTADNFIMQKET